MVQSPHYAPHFHSVSFFSPLGGGAEHFTGLFVHHQFYCTAVLLTVERLLNTSVHPPSGLYTEND